MFWFLVLTILVIKGQTAIIQSEDTKLTPPISFPLQIRTLTQNLIYSLTFSSDSNQTSKTSVFFTLASNNLSCNALFCYYGWINNYTVGEKSYDGYSVGSEDKLMIFMLKVNSNKTFSVTLNNKLNSLELNLIDLCYKVSNPLVAQISSLNPYNQSPKTSQLAVYSFFSLDQASKNEQIKKEMNFQQLTKSQVANTTFIGLNETSSSDYETFLDILAIDVSTNTLLNREINFVQKSQLKQERSIQLQLKSRSRFSNIEPMINSLQKLSQQKQNTNSYPILPKFVQLSQVELKFP